MQIEKKILKQGNPKKIVHKGTKITVDFVGRVKNTGQTFAETKQGSPITLIVGDNQLLATWEESFHGQGEGAIM